ncbi:glycosyltransferase family 2 protein [Metamycoplasma buccale]|uniref:glycosyltransferase family 2 protein n=1 Tax=Metamycoplasma buccale TaxID=55602 RepID=UPI00398E5433
MKKTYLTFIVPIYKPSKSIDAIFHNIIKQKDQNFNIVLTIDRPSEEDYESIAKVKKFFKNRIQIIINNSHQNINLVIKQALEFIKTEYSYIFYSYIHLKSEFTLRINAFLEKEFSPDFIEMTGYCRGLTKHSCLKDKFIENKVINLNSNKNPVAFISPYSFNFITKTEILKSIYKPILKFKNNNLQYSVETKFKSILLSNTFAYFSETWIEDWNEELIVLNPKNLINDWDNIISFAKSLKTDSINELLFAKKLNLEYFLAGYLGSIKSKKNTSEDRSIKLMKKNLLNFIKNMNKTLDDKIINLYFDKFNIKWKFDINDISTWSYLFKELIW